MDRLRIYGTLMNWLASPLSFCLIGCLLIHTSYLLYLKASSSKTLLIQLPLFFPKGGEGLILDIYRNFFFPVSQVNVNDLSLMSGGVVPAPNPVPKLR